MRLLKINGYIIELDDKTAIGVDVHGLDLTKPEDRYVNSSNSFTIPRSLRNLIAIGFIGGIANSKPAIYNNFSIQYFLNNEIAIDGAYVIIQEISERIKLNIVRKPTLWDEMKALGWDDFISEYFVYLYTFEGVDWLGSKFLGTEQQAIERYIDRSSSLFLSPAYSIEMDYLGIDYNTPQNNTFVLLGNNMIGSHFWSDATTLFKFIENKYGVDFDISGSHLDNPFIVPEFINTIFMTRSYAFSSAGGGTQWWIDISSLPYGMQNEVSENGNLSLYGLMYSILNIHGIVIENYDTNKYRLRDINYDIQNKKPIDISLNLEDVKTSKIVPFIKGYGQESIIKHSDYADGITSVNTRKIVECNNKNIQFRKTIINIENFIPAYKDDLMNYGVDKSFEQYKIATYENVNTSYTWRRGGIYSILRNNYRKAIPIDLSDKWGILDEALQDPLYIEAKCWLTPTQYSKINNWTLYYIPEFSGAYYINKVKGYNPEKSKQAVKLELIRINNNTPQ